LRISYLSDLHLDFHKDAGYNFLRSLKIPETDLLVIAGDLCDMSIVNPWQALRTFCRAAPHVLYVLGNHEYYHSTPRKTEDYIFNLATKLPNLTVAAQPKEFTLNGYKFLAGTMWFPDQPENVLYKNYMGDFYWIDFLEPRVYYDNKDFVKALEKRPDIVITHHMPSYKSVHPKFARSVINRFFITELDKKIDKYGVGVWIHGHSHEPVNYWIGDCQVVSNPFGYPDEAKADWQVQELRVCNLKDICEEK